MRNLLPDLDKGLPSILRGQFCTIGTLSVLDQVFDLKYLLQNCRCQHLPFFDKCPRTQLDQLKRQRTSFWIVSDTRNRFEWGSVQIKCASVSRTRFNPLSFFRQIARSSWDSGRAIIHCVGGARNRSQFRQYDTDAVRRSYH